MPPIRGRFRGTQEEIASWFIALYPGAASAMERISSRVPYLKRQIAPYQGIALYAIARAMAPSTILEIGTAWGYSAAVLAEAAPSAHIVTLNPKAHEVERAQKHLAAYRNVKILPEYSWDFLEKDCTEWDIVWIDGDHVQVRRDFPWFNRLRPGGLIFFHDYSPEGSWRPCPPVFEALHELQKALDRPFDILVQDTGEVGMAGFYRQEGEFYGEHLRNAG